MPSSPTLQPQRGVEGKSAADETVVDKLVDETAVEVEATACDVETPGEDEDGSCNDDAPRVAEDRACVEVTVDVWSSTDSTVWSSTDSGFAETSHKSRLENRREFSLVDRVSGSLLFPAGAGESSRTFRTPTDA